MSIPTLPERRKQSRYRNWRDQIKYGFELTPAAVEKFIKLNRILRKDAIKFGIPSIGVELVPRHYEGLATAANESYRIEGDGTLNIPSVVSYDFRMLDTLSLDELRSIGWHEFGHYMFAHYFPDIENKYYRDYDSYFVNETFADEVALRRFGDAYISASEKLLIILGDKDRDKEANEERIVTLKKMQSYRARYNKPYWIFLAKKLGVEVEMKPEKRVMVGIRPKKEFLNGLYP